MNNYSENTKTREQIAREYNISPRTLRRWLKTNDIHLPNRLLCPIDQNRIYEKFGYPIRYTNKTQKAE